MNPPPKDYPITGLCVVADPGKCPPGYDLLFYSEDKRDDCDLWKDSLFKARVTRYLCVTRIFPLDGGRLNNVVADIVIQNEKEIPPSGYSLIENTVDSGEKATRKKQICVKMITRNSTQNAISELIVLSRTKRAPAGYTIAGEINNLLFCFKFGPVPEAKTKISPTTPVSPALQPGLHSSQNGSYFRQGVPSPIVVENHQGMAAGLDEPSNSHHHPLSGVPFQINPKYRGSEGLSKTTAKDISYRSMVDIDNEYSYTFRLERGTAQNEHL